MSQTTSPELTITSKKDFPVHSLTDGLANTLFHFFATSNKNSQEGQEGELAIEIMSNLSKGRTPADPAEMIRKLLNVGASEITIEKRLTGLAELTLSMNRDEAQINGKEVTRKALLAIVIAKVELKNEDLMMANKPLVDEAWTRAALLKITLPSIFEKVLLPALNEVDLSDD